MLPRLAKLAAVSAHLRSLHEKRAGLVDLAWKGLKAGGKFALNHPLGTAVGVGAGAKGVSTFKSTFNGFKQSATPTF